MEGNQNSNPLDYSQSGVVYKDLNGNGTSASNIKSNEFVDQNGIKSPSAPSGQVTFIWTIFSFILFICPFEIHFKWKKAPHSKANTKYNIDDGVLSFVIHYLAFTSVSSCISSHIKR